MHLNCLCSESHHRHKHRDRKTLQGLLCFCPHRIRRKTQSSAAFFDAEGAYAQEKVGAENPRIFSYSELYIGSDGFHEKELLGSGGFGRVYRALLPSDGTPVAVKCLAERGESFRKTFMAELVAVAHLRHRNLVRLRGWCANNDELLLVYDYMPNRSLDRVLFKRPPEKNSADSVVLTWERRRKIVGGLAAALNYIHEELETQIIHRDVKTSNVMLDSNFNARLGDFGLARWLEHDLANEAKTSPVLKNRRFRLAESTGIGGTIGYLPPEGLRRKGVATAKSDVFSFGIVVLEVVSGRRAVDLTCPDEEIILLDWIRRLSDEGRLLQAGDARLRDWSYKLEDMERLLRLGLLCTFHGPQSRPSMKWVVKVLFGSVHGYKLPDLPSFRFHPPYISISYPSTMSNTLSSGTTTSDATNAHYSISSGFFSANEETIYMTAESETINQESATSNQAIVPKPFPVIETPRVIAFGEIVSATNNFSDSHRAAEVDFGTAYHGFLEGRHRVIIKRLGMKTCPALRIRFANELQGLGRLRHRNLIQLRGWCTEQGEMLVVYDYSPNFLLGRMLFHRGRKSWQSELLWHQRYSIIRSLASAVCYLHDEWDEQVIHRNITSSAVILDHDMNPRLGSFALAEFLTRNEHGDHVIVDEKKSVRGIFGYMPPEYVDSGEATTMADVYSFGVVLLEVVTGRMAVDFRQREVLLVKRVQKFEAQERAYRELVDWRLDGEYNEREVVRVVKLGLACTRSDPGLRPSMRQIVTTMDGCDQWLLEADRKKVEMEDWKQRNASSLSLIRRIQALTIQ